MTPRVSVLLPVRDAVGTVETALVSALASADGEPGANIEIVCVDDGSTDGTASVLAAQAERDSRIRVVTTAPRGIVAALNAAAAAARAPLLARMDADDEVVAGRWGIQARWLDSHPDVALCGTRVEVFRDGGVAGGFQRYANWVNGLVTHEAMECETFVECPIPHPTWMMHRSAFEAVGRYRDGAFPEDLELVYRLLAAGHRLGKVADVLYRWRDSDTRLSRTDPRYGRPAFTRLKAAYLSRLRSIDTAIVWGAGRTGRRLARSLEAERIPVRLFVDIAPARIGRSWHGIPIVAPDALAAELANAALGHDHLLGAVAQLGGRARIRQFLKALGLVEGVGFTMVA